MVGAGERSVLYERARLRRGRAAPTLSETCFPGEEGWLWLMPFSILIDVIVNGSENVEKNKCQCPVRLLLTGQTVIFVKIPGHPEPE
jgi:hypothetical protein